jgi:hypothetical protein
MARLSAHGVELARRETPTGCITVMADGQIMRNQGFGWKLWKRTKPGVNPVEYARKFNERTAAIMPEIRDYIKALMNACDLEHRVRLHTAISLMPQDPDGVWSEFDDYSGYSLDLDDICRACQAYLAAESAVAVATAAAVAEVK